MGFSFFLILGIVVWILVALWPALLAKSKGYNFWLFLLLSIITSFLVALIVAIIMPNKNETAQDRADEKAAEKALDHDEDVAVK